MFGWCPTIPHQLANAFISVGEHASCVQPAQCPYIGTLCIGQPSKRLTVRPLASDLLQNARLFVLLHIGRLGPRIICLPHTPPPYPASLRYSVHPADACCTFSINHSRPQPPCIDLFISYPFFQGIAGQEGSNKSHYPFPRWEQAANPDYSASKFAEWVPECVTKALAGWMFRRLG